MAEGGVGWHGAVSIGGRGWLYVGRPNLASTAVWPGDHIFAHKTAFRNHLRSASVLANGPKVAANGPKVARRRAGVARVAGSMADPFRQVAVSVGKNTHFLRELDPSRQFIWRAEGVGAMRKY
jgi:hypothetical protein